MQRRSKMGEESRSCRANVADRGVFRILINPRYCVVTTKQVKPGRSSGQPCIVNVDVHDLSTGDAHAVMLLPAVVLEKGASWDSLIPIG